MKALGITSTLSGSMNPLRQWVAQAMADQLKVLVVPGVDVARAQGIDAPLPLASNPREASILLIIAPFTQKLAEQAAVALAQMPRPRAILSVGVAILHPLPPADATVTDYILLADGLAEVRERLATQAWREEATPYEREVLTPESEETSSHQHHEHGSDSEHDRHQHEEDHDAQAEEEKNRHHAESKEGHQHQEESPEQGHTEGDAHGRDEHQHEEKHQRDGNEHQHGEHQYEEGHQGHEHHGHGGHDQGGGGMMLMEMMTQDLPRSKDGLPMDWNETHFGPFFPGLPGGLALCAQLDGDTVAQIAWVKGLTTRHMAEGFHGEATSFPERLAAVSIFSPQAYRVLAEQALEQIAGQRPADELLTQRIYQLERERTLNHLNGLAQLGVVVGNPWIEQQVHQLFFLVQQEAPVKNVQDKLVTLIRRIRKLPFLRQKLQRIGSIPAPLLRHTRGPVLRASRAAQDLRLDDPTYQQLDFRMQQEDSNDSWGRLLVRLGELEESLRLVLATEAAATDNHPVPIKAKDVSGIGKASIETARGATHLSLTVENGAIQQVTLDVHSFHHLALLSEVAAGQERVYDNFAKVSWGGK